MKDDVGLMDNSQQGISNFEITMKDIDAQLPQKPNRVVFASATGARYQSAHTVASSYQTLNQVATNESSAACD